MKYDVLLYISDQHSAATNGFMGDNIAETPFLDELAERSAVFENALTSCPLCVPARASFMTSRLPSNIGVFDNASDYKSSELTFAHMHAIAGYDTTLIGRMHFMGMDHFHGFTDRRFVDFSPSYWGYPSEKREDMGDFGRSLYQKWCTEVVGTGDSPTLDYDRKVVAEALSFLSEKHEKPQFTVVGTYGPHCPYVSDRKLLEKYEAKIRKEYIHTDSPELVKPAENKKQHIDDERLIHIRAAYYAMIETLDNQVKEVYEAYQEYLKREGKEGIFIYMSDHGDQIGYKELYGKQTFFDRAVHFPLIMEIPGIEAKRIKTPISIMDIGPTLQEINGVEENPVADGVSFRNLLVHEDEDRYAISEFYDMVDGEPVIGRMVQKGNLKFISYTGYENYDMLFDEAEDPSEENNIASTHPEEVNAFRRIIIEDRRFKDQRESFKEIKIKQKLLGRYGKNRQKELNYRSYVVPESCRYLENSL